MGNSPADEPPLFKHKGGIVTNPGVATNNSKLKTSGSRSQDNLAWITKITVSR